MENYIAIFTIGSFFTPLLSALSLFFTFEKLKKNIYKVSVAFAYIAVLLSFVSMVLFFLNSSDISLFQKSLISVYITPLTVVVIFFVSLVSLVIHLYSVKYMYDEEGYARYFILLDLMIFIIFALSTTGNILVLAFFWHMMGIILYFLLIHNLKEKQTTRYGFYTFFTHLLADVPLFIAVYLIYHFYQTTDLKLFLDMISHSSYHIDFLDTSYSVSSIIALLIMISALIKSAGFPFHIWLPYTLGGPNPVSALMHAGIVNAGAFIINRFAPLYLHGQIALHVALIIGFITAIFGSALMLMQNDIKKALAYSTVGQMGYMMLEIGSGAFALAIYHMMVHGIFKASLFLGSGGVIHEARNETNISDKSIFDFFFLKEKYKKQSIFEYLLFVIFIPMLIAFIIFHPLAKENSYDSAVIFYLFAWVAGSQAIYTMYRTHKRFKALFLTSIGFAFALLTYILVEHSFGGLLYPDENFAKSLYASASWSDASFFTIYGIITSIVLFIWISNYQILANNRSVFSRFNNAYNFLYRVFDREFYILDISSFISKTIIKSSQNINIFISSSRFKYPIIIIFTIFMILDTLLTHYKININFAEYIFLFFILLFSFRILSINNLKMYILYLYPIISSLISILYIENDMEYESLTILAIFVFILLGLYLIVSKKFSIIHKKSLVGLAGAMPRFSFLFVLSILGISLLLVIMEYEIVTAQNFSYPVIFLFSLLLSWFLVNWANIRLFEWLIYGEKKEDKTYVDLNNKQMIYFSAMLLLVVFVFLYHLFRSAI